MRKLLRFLARSQPTPTPGAGEETSARSTSEPGSRHIARGFFDDYPQFYETSETSPKPWRLNLRYEAIFNEHRDLFQGARVLDIASHDGRWSMAALRTGAAHVTGIEARQELVELANKNLADYQVTPGSYEFVQGDVFEVMARQPPQVDVAMCLGFFYHTLRYNELWTRIRECNPSYVVIDTLVEQETESIIRVTHEKVSRQGNAVADTFSYGDTMIIGRPSMKALRMMGNAYGFELMTTSDWAGLLRDNPDARAIGDYRSGRRITAVFRSASVA